MTTIADVAAKAGVSAATVSRVMTGKPQVAAATRDRVLAAAAELDYHPSRAARALARGRATSIGVVAPMAQSPSVGERLKGLSARLAPSGYDLSLFNVNSPQERDALLLELASPDRVGGVVLVSTAPEPDRIQILLDADVPVVAIDTKVPNIDCVYIDDLEGGRLAARTLLATGHRRIAFIGDSEDHEFGFTASRDRRIAFEDVLATASVELPTEYMKLGRHGADFAREATTELLELPSPPTAIFASSDVQAIGVMEAAHKAQKEVPGQLSIIGFDDIESARGMGLTTIRQPLEESGSHGAKLILEAIEHEPMGIAIELPLTVVNRRSTAAPTP